MSQIDRQFRKTMRHYPRWWRIQHEEALFGVLLDNAEAEGRETMTNAERRNLAATGTRMRLGTRVPHVLLLIALVGLAFVVASPFLVVGVGNTFAGVPLPSWFLNIVDSLAAVGVALAVFVVGLTAGLLLLRRTRAGRSPR